MSGVGSSEGIGRLKKAALGSSGGSCVSESATRRLGGTRGHHGAGLQPSSQAGRPSEQHGEGKAWRRSRLRGLCRPLSVRSTGTRKGLKLRIRSVQRGSESSPECGQKERWNLPWWPLRGRPGTSPSEQHPLSPVTAPPRW